MQESGKICAGRHANAGERLLDGAGSTHSGATFDYQDALTGARQVGSAGETIVTGAYNDRIPSLGSECADRCRKPHFA
jgi:hypothetical protein